MSRIDLHGGPWNGRSVRDRGKVVIRMGIASRWVGKRPAPGARCGLACYEPVADRSRAHWSGNEWDGTVVSVKEQGDLS